MKQWNIRYVALWIGVKVLLIILFHVVRKYHESSVYDAQFYILYRR